MTSLLIGVYGLYLIAVGVKGNTSQLASMVDADIKGFVPWLLIVVVLVALYDVPALKGFAEGVAVLIALGFIVSENSKITPQFKAFYDDITGAA